MIYAKYPLALETLYIRRNSLASLVSGIFKPIILCMYVEISYIISSKNEITLYH